MLLLWPTLKNLDLFSRQIITQEMDFEIDEWDGDYEAWDVRFSKI